MNVISLAFYRNSNSEYEQRENPGTFFKGYIKAIMRAYKYVWSDWNLWVYHDSAVTHWAEFKLLTRYQDAGLVSLIPMGEARSLTGSMLWRMEPGWDHGVDRFLCRDIDSLPTPRERKAVVRWENSNKPISALHDSTSHWGTVILGGMCGFKAEYVRSKFPTAQLFRTAMEESGIDFNKKGGDQHFLNRVFPEADCLSEWVDGLPWDVDANFCEGNARCVGGAFPNVEQVARWYDKHYPSPKIMGCERGT